MHKASLTRTCFFSKSFVTWYIAKGIATNEYTTAPYTNTGRTHKHSDEHTSKQPLTHTTNQVNKQASERASKLANGHLNKHN